MRRMNFGRIVATAAAAVVLPTLMVACSDDDDGDTDTDTPETTAPAETDTTDDEAPDEEDATDEEGDTTTTVADDAATTTTTEADEASSELGTTGIRDFLNAEDPEIGAYFDWDAGDGTIAINFFGQQAVSLYAVEIDVDTATVACELASDYVFDVDPNASLTVLTGGFPGGDELVSRDGADGSCAAV